MLRLLRFQRRRSRFVPPEPVLMDRLVTSDPWYLMCLRAQSEPDLTNIVYDVGRGSQLAAREMRWYNADNANFFRDTLQASHIVTDQASVTGTTTDKLIHKGALAFLPAYYFWRAGKKVKQQLNFRMTTGAAVGNIGMELYFGNADAATTLIQSSGATAGANSKTNIHCIAEAWCHSNQSADPAAVPLMATGRLMYDGAAALFTTTANNPLLVPATAPAATNVDSTSASGGGFSIQFKNSGANASTYQVHEAIFEALN